MLKTSRPRPLYEQIKGVLQHEIESKMKPGDTLPTEADLEKRFRVSRITIRRAMDELASEGLIVRRQGLGTFVRELRITQDLSQLVGWSAAMRQMGYEPRTMTTEMELITPGDDLRSALALGPSQRAVRVHRLCSVDDEPICLITNYLAEGLLPDLMQTGLVNDSMKATLSAHQIVPVRVQDIVEARSATEREAEQLRVEPGSPLLQVTSLSFDASGQPTLISVVSSRADKYRYTVDFQQVEADRGVIG